MEKFMCLFCGRDAGPGCLIMLGEENAIIPCCPVCEVHEPWVWDVVDFNSGEIIGEINYIADDYDRDHGFIVLRHGGVVKYTGLDLSRERPTLLVRCSDPADVVRWRELLKSPESIELEKFGCA